MKKVLSIILFGFILSLSQAFAVTIADESVSGVDRYAIYIGANDGGKGRERLLYAGTDALSFKNAMSEIGGVADSNCRVLIDPTKDSIDNALQEISNAINSKSGQTKRSEFIFYYSGHSDENALLLGNSKYDYSKLKAAITEVPSDIHVVILDSCYSGNFIRTKGGQKRKPFLIDDSSVVTGHAYLSSSSDNESSQESDEIESSYFTNAMITGLRGAADTSGDNKVTLNELYSYAFSDTLSKTESSKAGPQHPNYNITLVGSGDLILSDLTIADSMLSLSKEAKGRFIIRDSNDKLISEINKSAGQPIFIALPMGQYSALIIDEYSTKQGTFILEKDQVYVLDQNSLGSIKRKSNRLRGDANVENEDSAEEITSEEEEETLNLEELPPKKQKILVERHTIDEMDDLPDLVEDSDEDSDVDMDFDIDFSKFYGIQIDVVPGVSLINEDSDSKDSHTFHLGLIGSTPHNVYGLNFSSIMNISTGTIAGFQNATFNISKGYNFGVQAGDIFNIANGVKGAQLAGVYNFTDTIHGSQIAGVTNIAKTVKGSQIAGVGNIGKNINGVQVAGVFNVAHTVNGAQIGLINIAKENNGITIGLLNFVGNGLQDINTSINTNGIIDFYYQGGAKKLYTVMGYGKDIHDEDGVERGISYIGLGTQIPLGVFSFEVEGLFKVAWYNPDYYPEYVEMMKGHSAFKFIQELSYPSFRMNWNVLNSSFVSLFISTCFDLFIPGQNDIAYELFSTNMQIEDEDFIVSPSFAIGGKLHL